MTPCSWRSATTPTAGSTCRTAKGGGTTTGRRFQWGVPQVRRAPKEKKATLVRRARKALKGSRVPSVRRGPLGRRATRATRVRSVPLGQRGPKGTKATPVRLGSKVLQGSRVASVRQGLPGRRATRATPARRVTRVRSVPPAQRGLKEKRDRKSVV